MKKLVKSRRDLDPLSQSEAAGERASSDTQCIKVENQSAEHRDQSPPGGRTLHMHAVPASAQGFHYAGSITAIKRQRGVGIHPHI